MRTWQKPQYTPKGHVIFPDMLPFHEHSGGLLWALQCELVVLAEELLGPMHGEVFQPEFFDHGPYMKRRDEGDGGWARLSRNAETSWHTVVYEMAHETIHLLDPVEAKHTNVLEEGAAVAFSARMTKQLLGRVMRPNDYPVYLKAWALVKKLPHPLFSSLRALRTEAGSLGAVQVEHIRTAFPEVNNSLTTQLVQVCKGREI